MGGTPTPVVRAILASALLLAAAPPSPAQHPDLSGTWELTDPPPAPAFERARPDVGPSAPCDPDAAKIRLLGLLAQPLRRFTVTQTDATLVITSANGSSNTFLLDGPEGTLSVGSIHVVHQARWAPDGVLTIDWKPGFGGTIVERLRLAPDRARLQIDQSIEHEVLSRPARQHLSYRRLTEPPSAGGASGSPQTVGQVADTAFRPPIDRPAYPAGAGPVVLIDEAHANFHTATGRYQPFAELLRRDGYIVRSSAERFTTGILAGARVLVMANARDALTAAEVTAVHDWVVGGGALLLITDHPPFVDAALDLARAFGVRLGNSAAADPTIADGRLTFRRSDGTLRDHPITRGIDEVVTFTGSSLEVDAPAQPLLVFGPGVCSGGLDPDPVSLAGHAQGAAFSSGAGRVAVFGEAAMFSAQVSGPNRSPMGMNAPVAKQNAQFLLNVMHWLTRLP